MPFQEPRTQSTVWYLSLPLWEKANTKLPKRRSFTGRIKAVCEQLGTTREALGIYAKARSTMYFNGVQTAVSYNKIESLAKNGTDIIFIEKEAIVEVLCQYADKHGIALVDSEGFLTDYGRKLIEEATVSGANVAIVSDYDASGIKLAHDAGDIPRLGVDQEMLDHFGLDRESTLISVKNTAAIDVMTRIKGLVDPDVYEFLSRRKVEIDAVIAVKGSKDFWEYIIKKLEEHYPTRDATRVISTSPDASSFYPQSLKDINSSLQTYIDLILDDEEEKVEGELEEFEGIIEDIGEKDREIDERYQAIVDKDETLMELGQKFTTEIKPLLDKLKDLTTKITNEKLQKKAEQEKEKRERRSKISNSDIQDIEGVGPTTARLLSEHDITTAMDLAEIGISKLTIILRGARDRAWELKKAAKKLLEDQEKKSDK